MEKKHPINGCLEDEQQDFTETISHIMFDDLVPPEKTEKTEHDKPKQPENK